MKSLDIRKKFFDFFIARGHTQVASSGLIPAQDPTLLFTNAGMNQFKDVFLGKEQRSYKRAVSIQKCVRAGGKHNDLDNVGFTKRHLTFFEMMGNFSFGDYFKKEAIHYAWDFLTKELKMPANNLHATVYKTDDQAYDIWHKEIGIPANRMHRLGEKENFWQMGDTGPCGPCTEIHIDRGAEFGCADEKNCGPACDCDRFLEIWNLVFMQFDRQPDGSDKPLKQTGVDTGMGLERLCAVIQNKDSVYETDLFTPIIAKIEQLAGLKYAQQNDQLKAAFHVLADHIRSSTFIISDGAAPSNEGRGYVLRKIIRRAALFAQKLSSDQSLFPQLSRVVVEEFGAIYPELKTNATLIYKVLESEINKFSANLVRGQAILNDYFKDSSKTKIISGEQAFKLYDTYGFPLELIQVIAHEKGFRVDENGFNAFMQKQQEQSGKKVADELEHIALPDSVTTEFTGYKELDTKSIVTALIVDNKIVQSVKSGQTCWLIAQKSPFFIVGGGQVPDQGWIEIDKQKVAIEHVRFIGDAIGVLITAPIDIKVGDAITSMVDPIWRINAMKNHTATHLLQSALIEVFGKTIKQSGSLVHPDYLRFDFTHHENLTPAQIKQVEDIVNQKIRENIKVNVEYLSLPEALKKGALAFFGDKYNPEKVRMIQVSDFSVELCGGTHVHATGDIGTFKITEVVALSAGQRRIFAVTGPRAIDLFQEVYSMVKSLSQEFKVQKEQVLGAIEKQKQEQRSLEQHIKALKKELYKISITKWLSNLEMIKDISYAFIQLDDAQVTDLKDIGQQLIAQKSGFYVLTNQSNNKAFIFCIASPDMASKLNWHDFASWIAQKQSIKGGVSKNSFQGGAIEFSSNLNNEIKKWLETHI